jgi:hypothetical protein
VKRSKVDGVPRAYRWTEAPSAEYIGDEAADDDSGDGLAGIVAARRRGERYGDDKSILPVPRETSKINSDGRTTGPDGMPDPFRVATGRMFTFDEAVAYVRGDLEAFAGMRTPEDHGFNQRLNAVAMRMGHFVPEFWSHDEAGSALYTAAETNRSIEWQGQRAVVATIKSGLAAGMREPYRLSGPSRESETEGSAAGAGQSGEPGSNGSAGGALADIARAGAEPTDEEVDALLAEMLSGEAMLKQPNPKPLIRGVLDLDTISWIIGKSGSYKSFVALDMAGCVATGREWHGHAVTQGRVIYLVAEGARGMKLRLAAWERLNGPIGPDILFLPRPVQAADRRAWSTLVKACAKFGPSLVIIDTQARVTVGFDENDNSSMGEFIEQVDKIKRATGACVVPVHHIGRSGTDARGASALDGAQDAELRVSRLSPLRIEIINDKQKDQDDSEVISLALRKSESLIESERVDPETGRDLSSLVVVDMNAALAVPEAQDWVDNLTGNRGEIKGYVREHFPFIGGTKAEIKAIVRERRAMKSRPGMTDSSFRTAWSYLVRDGDLVQVEGSQRFLAVARVMDAAGDGSAGSSAGSGGTGLSGVRLAGDGSGAGADSDET